MLLQMAIFLFFLWLSNILFHIPICIYMRNAGLEEAQAGIKIAGRNINNLRYAEQFSSVTQSVQLFVTPWITAGQASLSITNSQSLPKLMSIKSVTPSSHLIRCCPLRFLPPIPPSIRVFSSESTLCMSWPKYWSFQFQHQSFQWIIHPQMSIMPKWGNPALELALTTPSNSHGFLFPLFRCLLTARPLGSSSIISHSITPFPVTLLHSSIALILVWLYIFVSMVVY